MFRLDWRLANDHRLFDPNTELNGKALMSSRRPPSDSEDIALLQRIAAQDQVAFRGLYDRHHQGIYRFVQGRLRDEALAEDVTMEVFWDVWRGAGKFAGQSAVRTWLFAIARNKAVSALRKRRDAQLDDEYAERISDDADTPETVSQKSSKASALRECIKTLSDKHREIIDLVYYQEMSVKDVAGVLEIPENTVKTRMFHARKQLSAELERAGLDANWP